MGLFPEMHLSSILKSIFIKIKLKNIYFQSFNRRENRALINYYLFKVVFRKLNKINLEHKTTIEN